VTSKYAEVRKNRDFGSRPTIHFHGYKWMPNLIMPGLTPHPTGMEIGPVEDQVDIAKPHSDWVVKIDDNDHLGFTVQTLKREFWDSDDDTLVKAGTTIASFLLPPRMATAALRLDDPVEINRMHFLAGRRSWRLHDGKNFEVDGGVLVLGTCAIERVSHRAYQLADRPLGLEAALIPVWTSMLKNFVKMKALVKFPQRLRPGWEREDHIYWYTKSFDSLEALTRDREFAQQKRMNLYKTLLPEQ